MKERQSLNTPVSQYWYRSLWVSKGESGGEATQELKTGGVLQQKLIKEIL
jgi:hypothetical protein